MDLGIFCAFYLIYSKTAKYIHIRRVQQNLKYNLIIQLHFKFHFLWRPIFFLVFGSKKKLFLKSLIFAIFFFYSSTKQILTFIRNNSCCSFYLVIRCFCKFVVLIGLQKICIAYIYVMDLIDIVIISYRVSYW